MSKEGNAKNSTIDPRDQEVIDEIYEIARGVVRTYHIGAHLGADDIAQGVLVNLLRHGSNWRGVVPRRVYLRAAVRHEIIDQWRKTRGAVTVPIDEVWVAETLASEAPDPERETLATERTIILEELIKTFDKEEAEILRMTILGYKSKEIARRFGISDDNVRQQISRLRAKLRDRLSLSSG